MAEQNTARAAASDAYEKITRLFRDRVPSDQEQLSGILHWLNGKQNGARKAGVYDPSEPAYAANDPFFLDPDSGELIHIGEPAPHCDTTEARRERLGLKVHEGGRGAE